MADYGLNEEQLKAVTSPSPASLIRASAGSGKTRCLIAKIRYILDNGASPDSICAITFTNKAAKEMKERLKKFCDVSKIQVSTIHSMCVRIIRTFSNFTVLKVPFSIYDDSDQLSVVKTVMKSRDIPGKHDEMLSAISRAKSDQSEDSLDGYEREVYLAYQNILFKNNACDFDDLLIYANDCLKKEPCQRHFNDLWKHILVDEFQDTSTLQYDIIRKLYNINKTKSITCIGDINQSIYGWRAAKPENIMHYITTIKPEVYDLTFNYRSAPEIIKHANKFLQFGKTMVTKSDTKGLVSFSQFNTQEDEADKISDAILKMGGYESTAVLFRVNTRSLLFEREFTMKRIPYKIVGALPFYKRRVSKDLLAYCKAALNRSDLESLNRIVNTPKRGFGAAKQEELLVKGWPYLEQCAEQIPAISDLIHILNDIRKMKPYDAVQHILRQTQYKESLIKENDQRMLEAFLNIVYDFNTLEELILASTFLEEDSGQGVKLMTAHSSKGLEFDKVFVVGVEDGVWPHKLSENLEEESRLYYVACTRARKFINVSYSKNRMLRGKPEKVSPSHLFTKSVTNI